MQLPASSLAALTLFLLVTPTPAAQALPPQAATTAPASSPITQPNSVDGAHRLSLAGAQANTCPVSLAVHHAPGLVVTRRIGSDNSPSADSNRTYRAPSQSLELNIRNLGLADIVSIDAIVHMLPASDRLMPLVRDNVPRGIDLPMHLGRKVSRNAEVTLSWTLANSSPVEYIQINQVTYRDGSTWNAPATLLHPTSTTSPCRFTLDPLTLVSER